MSAISIVIPTWNGLELLEEFLPSVLRAADNYLQEKNEPVQIFIVDDCSDDRTSKWLLDQGFEEIMESGDDTGPIEPLENQQHVGLEPSVVGPGSLHQNGGADVRPQITKTFIRNRSNQGFSRSCNRGFKLASHGLVLLLNNDAAPAADALAFLQSNFSDPLTFAAHCRVFDSRSGREVGTGKICSFARGFIRVHRSYVARGVETGPKQNSARLYSAFAGGGASMFDRAKFLQLGGFDELLSPFYWEDVEISYRAWKRGYKVLYEPRAVAHHRISSTISRLSKVKVRRIQQRNRIIYHWIHLHDRRMFLSHVLWLILLTLTAPIRLEPAFLASMLSAVKRLPEIRNRRKAEKAAARLTDRAVMDVFKRLAEQPGIILYDRESELTPAMSIGEG